MASRLALAIVSVLTSTALSLSAVPDPAAGGQPLKTQAQMAENAPWQWPVDSFAEIVHDFDPPAQRWLPGHRGVDLAASADESVRAVDDGVVRFSGEIAGMGILSISHDDGLVSTYQPIDVVVSRGEVVSRGQIIGSVIEGPDHCAIRTCLHLGAKRGDTYLNPRLLLDSYQVVLLPL